MTDAVAMEEGATPVRAGERLYGVVAALSEALSAEQVGAVVVREGVAALEADRGVLGVLRDGSDRLEIVSTVGYPEGVFEAGLALDSGRPIAEVARTGRPIWLESREQALEEWPALRPILERSGSQALASVPLLVGERLVGVLGVSYDAPHAFGAAERGFFFALAGQCAQALERARLFAAERRARAEAERQAEENARLNAELRTNLGVLRAVTEGTADAIFAKDADGRYFLVNPAAASVLGCSQSEALGKTARDLLPPAVADAIASHDAEVMAAGETRTYEETVVTRGETRTFLSTKSPYRDERGNVAGIIGISRDITERTRREVAQRFLAEASTRLAASLDYERTLREVAQLAVPELADWCVVDVPERGPGTPRGPGLRRLAVAHVDPTKVRLAYELSERYPPDPDARVGAPNVLRTGRAELVEEIPDALLEGAARSAEHLDLLRRLGLRSYVSVPMKLQGRTFGVVTLVSAESGRRFDQADLALAEELAYRAALAVHNAELYREVRERAEAQQQLNTALREVAEARDRAIAELKEALRARGSDGA